jgi:hypothetical protein
MLYHPQYQNPVLNGTISHSHLTSLYDRYTLITDCRKIKKYDVEVTSIGLTAKTDFVELSHLYQKLKEETKYRERVDPICLNFSQFKEKMSGL